MRRYGNVVGILLAGLAGLLGAAMMLRMAWNWTLPDVFGFGPIPFRHVLGVVLLGLLMVGLVGIGRQRSTRFNWRD